MKISIRLQRRQYNLWWLQRSVHRSWKFEKDMRGIVMMVWSLFAISTLKKKSDKIFFLKQLFFFFLLSKRTKLKLGDVEQWPHWYLVPTIIYERWKAIKVRLLRYKRWMSFFQFDLLDGSYYRGFDGHQLKNEIERPLNQCRSKSVHSKISPTRP